MGGVLGYAGGGGIRPSSQEVRSQVFFILAVLSLAVVGSETDFEGITSSLLCPCCDKMVVLDCNCKTAEEIKTLVRGMINEGAETEEIIEELKGRYGESIVPIPPERGFGLMAWISSILAFLGGSSLVALALRRWVSKGGGREVELPVADIERYRDRIERELMRFR